MHELSAEPFLLRAYEAADVADFVAAVQESKDTVGRWMTWATPGFGEDEALEWFKSCAVSRSSGSAHEFGIFESCGRFVGGAGLNQFNLLNDFCNLGYWVRESAQRRGAATAAVLALSQFAFGQLGQFRVEIVVAAGNEPSRSVAVKAGAALECLARNRLKIHGNLVAAHVYSLVPASVV